MNRYLGLRVEPLLEHVLDGVDAAARTIALIAEHNVGRARGGTEPTMDASPKDAVGFPDIRIVELRFREIGLHCA